MATVACIVLNWNGGGRVLDCLRSVRASTGIAPSLFVVDNGSTDGSRDAIEREFPGALRLSNDTNVGLVHARNQALEEILKTDHELVLFLDNDALLAPQTLGQLVGVLDSHPVAGIVTPRILDASDGSSIWYDGGIVNAFGETRHRHFRKRTYELPVPMSGEPSGVDFATGCCMLVRRRVFETVGVFDEDFFVYSEDAEFSFRVRRAGYRIVHVPQAIAWHHQSSDTRRNRGKWFRDYYDIRNKLLLVRKSPLGVPRAVAYGWIMLRNVLPLLVYSLCTGQLQRVRATIEGIGDFLKGRYGQRWT